MTTHADKQRRLDQLKRKRVTEDKATWAVRQGDHIDFNSHFYLPDFFDNAVTAKAFARLESDLNDSITAVYRKVTVRRAGMGLVPIWQFAESFRIC